MRILSVFTGFPGAHSLRVSPFACVYHFNSSSEFRSGFPSPGMKCPRNQPRVSFEAAATFPEIGAGVSELMKSLSLRLWLTVQRGLTRLLIQILPLPIIDFIANVVGRGSYGVGIEVDVQLRAFAILIARFAVLLGSIGHMQFDRVRDEAAWALDARDRTAAVRLAP